MQKCLTKTFLVSVLIPVSVELLTAPGMRKLQNSKFDRSNINPFIREGGTSNWLQPYRLSYLRGGSDELDVMESSMQSAAHIEPFRIDVDTKSKAIRQLQLDSCQRSMDACFQR
jgi:hypothetical protein